MKHQPAEEQGLKAERVQLWQRVIDTCRSLASRIYVVLEWLVAIGGALKSIFDNRGFGNKS